MFNRIAILAYHAITLANQENLPAGWSAMHAVRLDSFRDQLGVIERAGLHTILPETIGTASPTTRKNSCLLTFDDGHRSDLMAAAVMKTRGFRGIFYVPWVHIGLEGYLNASDVKNLEAAGFAIGSHGMTHTPLTEKPERDLQYELVESRQRLEDLIGRSVDDLAIPFGRYNQQVIGEARKAGYKRIMTSDFGLARIGTADVFPRLPVTARTSLNQFRRMLSVGPLGAAMLRINRAATKRIRSVRAG